MAFFLEKYPEPSVCLFVGLIAGMLPSLMREAGKEGRTKGSLVSMGIAAAVIFGILTALNLLSVSIVPNVGWYVFCGVCLALSVIVPGMSFSTLLMPLGLYTPFVDGLGHLKMGILIPSGIGAVVTVICFAKMVDILLEKYYSYVFPCHCRNCSSGNGYDHTISEFCVIVSCRNDKSGLYGGWNCLFLFIEPVQKRRLKEIVKKIVGFTIFFTRLYKEM